MIPDDCTIAQLSAAVFSPTLHVAVVKDGTGVEGSSIHRNSRSARTEVDGGGRRCLGVGM